MMTRLSQIKLFQPTALRTAITLACSLMALSGAGAAQGARYFVPPLDIPIVGEVQRYTTVRTDTLSDIARLYGVGHDEIVAANPGVDVWMPGVGVDVVLPTRFILPDAPRRGIVVNLPEMRLYHYAEDSAGRAIVTTHPVSVGRMDWRTPLGASKVVAKVADPNWYPPKSIRKEHAEDGDPLPKVVLAGPDNPLGQHMLRLGIPGYLIHGTNRPYGVGMRVTHGCLRMYPEDIAWLFGEVDVSTPVMLLNQPYKLARLGGRFFVEMHSSLEEEVLSAEKTRDDVLRDIELQAGSDAVAYVDRVALMNVIHEANGVPVPVPLLDAPMALDPLEEIGF